jgi:LacI family transcriptional regulator
MAAPKRVTSRQVARYAGVSQTTVSLVLNNAPHANISQTTRERVLQAAQELGYTPDAAARSLARGRSSNIGLVLIQPHAQIFIDEYVPALLTGLNRLAHQHDYRILVKIVDDASNPDALTQLISGKEVAGLITQVGKLSQPSLDMLASYVRSGFPVVTLDYLTDALPAVYIDKVQGVRLAVEHLISLGHQRIACIPYAPPTENRHVHDRLNCFISTLEAAGLTYEPALVEAGAFDPRTGYEAALRLFERRPWPTALFAMNDVMAFGALEAMRQLGIRVPQDIALVGFDDIRLAAYANPPLTTIREPDIELGHYAAQQIIDLIEGHDLAERNIRLATELIVRESCGASQTLS